MNPRRQTSRVAMIHIIHSQRESKSLHSIYTPQLGRTPINYCPTEGPTLRPALIGNPVRKEKQYTYP